MADLLEILVPGAATATQVLIPSAPTVVEVISPAAPTVVEILTAPRGPQGEPGGQLGVEYIISTPSASWTVPIPAGILRRPSVTVFDSLGEEIEPDVLVDLTNRVVNLVFAVPTNGSVTVN